MNILKRSLAAVLLLLLMNACQDSKPTSLSSFPITLGKDTPINSPAPINKSGKLRTDAALSSIYTPMTLDTFTFPMIDADLVKGLERQKQLLQLRRQKSIHQVDELTIDLLQLEKTISILEQWQHVLPIGIEEELEAYHIWGRDKRGNVRFTGYYTPVISVSKQRTARFRYPICERPLNWQGRYPTRQEIENGKLANSTVAYAERISDIYNLKMQGSGFVEFPNGQRKMLLFDGTNGYPFVRTNVSPSSEDSTATTTNPSYPFFQVVDSSPLGAGHVPLTDEYSVAVDNKYIPLGSCLLAAVPKIDKAGNFLGHEYRILLAQDVGGGVKGPGHIDVYCGVGSEGKQKAQYFSHYGRLWLLLPKKSKAQGPVFTSM